MRPPFSFADGIMGVLNYPWIRQIDKARDKGTRSVVFSNPLGHSLPLSVAGHELMSNGSPIYFYFDTARGCPPSVTRMRRSAVPPGKGSRFPAIPV